MKHFLAPNAGRSLWLSRAFIYLFALLLLGLDGSAPWLVPAVLSKHFDLPSGSIAGWTIALVYINSVFAWYLLVSLHSLICALQQGEVFTLPNMIRLRRVSWCCFLCAGVCLLGAFGFRPWLVVAVPAAFVGLIVRIVKNVFEQAALMKDELDYTV